MSDFILESTGKDKRHVGETSDTFTQHLKIAKSWIEDEEPWMLYFHVTISRWRLLGRYSTQQEAIMDSDFWVTRFKIERLHAFYDNRVKDHWNRWLRDESAARARRIESGS